MKLAKKILYTFITIIFISLIFVIIGFVSLNSKVNSDEDVIIVIEKNMSINQILTNLNKQQILTPNIFYKFVIRIYAKITNGKLYAGVHKFNKNLTNAQLIFQLFTPDNLQSIRVTFPEGITINRFAAILQNRMNIDSIDFVNHCNDAVVCKNLGVEQNSLEGYLKPVTYNFPIEATIIDILKILVKEQQKELNKFAEDIAKTKYNKHQILTLASIIEAETPVIAERKRISGVFHNRLDKNMLLQADPTVQYILRERKERILYSDLEIDNPYNTYKYAGLPPGPINNPSSSSIEAAIFPESHNYLYFVAIGDGSNRHNFSTNYAQHLQYVNVYKKNLKR